MSDSTPAPADATPPATAAAPPGSAPARPGLLERLPWYTVPALLVGIPLLIAAGAAVAPETVYDGFVWPYYWGPIQADAENHARLLLCPDGTTTPNFCPNGATGIEATSGYNIINTASWAILLGLCLLGISQILQRTKVPMDSKLIIGATGWVVAGSIFHVMEDVGLLATPLQYFFITPPIYLLFGVGGVASLLIGHYLKGVAEKANLELALQKLLFIVATPILLYLVAWLQPWNQVTHYINPVYVTLMGLGVYLLTARHFRRIGRIDPAALVGWMSLGWILLALGYVALFQSEPWFPQRNPLPTALLAPVLAAAVAGLAFLFGLFTVGRFEGKGKGKARDFSRALLQPINLLLIGSQMLDGFATAIGIDTGGYDEKHVLSAKVIEVTRDAGANLGLGFVEQYPTFIGFATVKLAVSLLVIYAIDANKDAKTNPTLTGLVKFAIIMVGLGPGIRDFVRMALGV
ncbi:MAG: DUF63 family protein [Candidatus Thermoplasmatota archaeon]